MLNAQLVKMLRPKTRARTNIGDRKRASEEDKSPTKQTKLPEITSMPTLDSPMGENSEASQEYATPTDSSTPADTAAKPTSPTVDLSGPPSPYEEPALRKQFRWGKTEVKTFKPDKKLNETQTNTVAKSPAGPRAESPTGTGKGQVPTRIVANALQQPYAYTKHTASPKGDKIPSVAKAIGEVSRLPTKVALGTNREGEIEEMITSWWEDTRDLPHAESRPEEFCKLGLPEVALDTEESGEGGATQHQILRHTQRYFLLYLRYLGDVIRRALELGEEARVFNIEHTQLWTNREGKVVQIDQAFKKRPIALFVLFNTNFLVPMTVVEDPWVDLEPPRVIPRVYVWSLYKQPSGTLRSRTVQVSSPQLRGITVAQAAGILGDLVTQQGWGGSGAISKIRKGASDETPADNKIREVLFLVTHHQDLAQQLIKDNGLDFGFTTKKGLLPSAAEKTALGQREVAIIDYSQQLFVGHRVRIVDAVTKKLSALAVQQGIQQRDSEDACLVFEKHLGTPRWAPSDNTVESLLQWKRNRNDTINFYAIFTETAYGLLVKAGSTIEVDVHLSDNETTGEKTFIPVKVEVGRWSLMGTKSKHKQTAAPHPQHQGRGTTNEEKLRVTGEAAIYNMQKTTEDCLRKVQQAATPAPPVSSATPETKHLLHNIGHELELLNQKAAAAAARTEVIETKAAERHLDITTGIRDFHSTYKDSGRAMVDTLMTLTDRLTKNHEEDKQEANSEGGLGRWVPRSTNTTASKEEGSTQPSQRGKVQYVATDSTEVRKTKYDKYISNFLEGQDPYEYRGIPYMGPSKHTGASSEKRKGLGFRKPVVAKVSRAEPKTDKPPDKKAKGPQGAPEKIPTGVPASGQPTTRRTTRQSTKRSMSQDSSP
ncbi:hypothetical protein CYMTET_17954 [Cymbomonas tetramitiformis]|uniref:Uncharacterized protein n=1 Tax=Cymbomonas tetramitiformis TaxID=36881 RepID=A0AAE0G9E3_9CHLO|nr:hypothetical protein CYMTET_17954 [Cymbomonas tetramitiformis]